jgi:hypothetical protein
LYACATVSFLHTTLRKCNQMRARVGAKLD